MLLLTYVAAAVCWWRIFRKAGQPGWTAFVPILDAITLLKVARRPVWWVLLLLTPGLNLVFLVLVMLGLAESFGKDVRFAVGLILLSVVFVPLLAFGNAVCTAPQDEALAA